MFFANPIWLLALIPWTALAVWMLWGRRERIGVPFLVLWRGGDVRPSASRAIQAPPLPIVLMLLGMLLAIVATGSPTAPAPGPALLTVILDRGITMSARDGGTYRYVRVARQVADIIGPAAHVLVLPVPGAEQTTDQRGFAALAESLPPTALDTSADMKQVVTRALHERDEWVIAVTDQPLDLNLNLGLDLDDPRLVIASPPPLPPNVGIAHVAARATPSPQVMVRIHADAPSDVAVAIISDGKRVERVIGAPGTTFIDVPRLGNTIEVTLTPSDALSADDRAWLVRETGWPRIEPVAVLPAELARMVEAHRKIRPPRQTGPVVTIVNAINEAASETVILAPATGRGTGAIHVVDHPVAANVAWAEVLSDARFGEAAPPGFTPVVAANDRVAVAVRETPRQVWVALESSAFARTADYVLFWTNVFDWLGRGGDTFEAHPIGQLGDAWRRVTDGPAGVQPGMWPGIYERSDGTLRAVNAAAPATSAAPAMYDWQQRLAQRLSSPGLGARNLSPYLLLAALTCALGAAVRWPARHAAQA